APVISTVTPTRAPVGTEVTVTGSNFSTAANNGSVIFTDPAGNPVIAENYRIENGNILFNVPANAVSGSFIVQNQYGNTSTPFTVTTPVVSTFSPARAPIGTVITVTGANFVPASEGGRMQFLDAYDEPIEADNYQYISSTEVRGTVPSETGPSGAITVFGLDGQAMASATEFEVGTLPVELVNFTAVSSPKGVVLNWQTASERDNAYFEVQSTTDLKAGQFKTLGQVTSKVTNSSVATVYEFEDSSPAGGQTYYRLKQVDLNGSHEYSKVITVTTKEVVKGSQFVRAYPNPFNQQIQLEVDAVSSGILTVKLHNITGNKAFENTISVESGRATVEIEISQTIPSGVYILTTELNGEVVTQRFLKQ
ncbi:IPT/TIG domain-containing protein, partial [Rufibacter roseus]